MNPEVRDQLLHAASLLTKAASMLEYNVNLKKEAAATADELIDRGLLSEDQRETFTESLMENPHKIATLKTAALELPARHSSGELGEVSSEMFNSNIAGDAFDRALYE